MRIFCGNWIELVDHQINIKSMTSNYKEHNLLQYSQENSNIYFYTWTLNIIHSSMIQICSKFRIFYIMNDTKRREKLRLDHKNNISRIKEIRRNQNTSDVSTPLEIKLSANCDAMLVTRIEANGGPTET